MKITWIAAVLLATVLSACNAGPRMVDPGCPDDLRPVVSPMSVNLLPEETVQASYKVFTCGGQEELQITPIWVSADTAIATVSDTGLITAQLLGGNTDITVTEAEYGIEAVIKVNVADVAPLP